MKRKSPQPALWPDLYVRAPGSRSEEGTEKDDARGRVTENASFSERKSLAESDRVAEDGAGEELPKELTEVAGAQQAELTPERVPAEQAPSRTESPTSTGTSGVPEQTAETFLERTESSLDGVHESKMVRAAMPELAPVTVIRSEEKKVAAMGSFGERLKREREMRGVTLNEISLSTKISTRNLSALETERFDQLPGGIFNKGFVRAYAKYLGLDEEQTVADYIGAAADQEAKRGPALLGFGKSARRSADEGKVIAIRAAADPRSEMVGARDGGWDRAHAVEREADADPGPESDPAAMLLKLAVIVVVLLGLGGAFFKFVYESRRFPSAQRQSGQASGPSAADGSAQTNNSARSNSSAPSASSPAGGVSQSVTSTSAADKGAQTGSRASTADRTSAVPDAQTTGIAGAASGAANGVAANHAGADSADTKIPGANIVKTSVADPSGKETAANNGKTSTAAPTSSTDSALGKNLGQTAGAAPISAPITVLVTAREESWVQVLSHGKVIMDMTLQPGASKRFRAADEMTLRLGNAPSVDVNYNGQLLPPPAQEKKTRIIRFTAKGAQE